MSQPDLHSFAKPEQACVRHLALDLEVVFDQRTIRGSVVLSIDVSYPEVPDAPEIILDTRDLLIDRIEISPDAGRFAATTFELGNSDRVLGSRLAVRIESSTRYVRIFYSTSPQSTALQWLDPAQTAGGGHPFLYTQSQAIHARSWIPLQDSPGVRVTYDARVRLSSDLNVVMSASRAIADGVAQFHMPQPIPPYLIALAAGDIAFRSLGPRTGVWAEPKILESAAWEFADVENMLIAAEELYGPYRWDRYDLIVLPPSFPFGGMENPRMTFATPTVIVGDRSLVSLVAHELAHSWSGNLVTNATWSDFWLNEGFTVYIERRIIERLYGKDRAEMEATLGLNELQRALARHEPSDQILHIDLTGRDPDDGCTQIPYEKGALFLRQIEAVVGRNKFDHYLREYFDRFAFTSLTTDQALAFLLEKLPEAARTIPVHDWIFEPGLPASAKLPHSALLEAVKKEAAIKGPRSSTPNWSAHEWLAYLQSLPEKLSADELARLDGSYDLTATRNCEVLAEWLLISVRNSYEPAYARLEEFLMSVGRRKYVKPLYEAMPQDLALRIYARARPGYHPITQSTIDALLLQTRLAQTKQSAE